MESIYQQVAGWSPGEWCLMGAQCWSLLLIDVALSSSCSLVSLGESPYYSSPLITSISATMDTLSMDTQDEVRAAWKKRLTVYRIDHPIYLITEFFLTNFPIKLLPSL